MIQHAQCILFIDDYGKVVFMKLKAIKFITMKSKGPLN